MTNLNQLRPDVRKQPTCTLVPCICDADGFFSAGSNYDQHTVNTPEEFFALQEDNYVVPEVLAVMNSPTSAAKLLPLRKLECNRYKDANIKSFKLICKDGNLWSFGDLQQNLKHGDSYQSTIDYDALVESHLYDDDPAAFFQLLVEVQTSLARDLVLKENTAYLYGNKNRGIFGLLNNPAIDKPLTPKTVTIDGTDKITWPDKLADTHNAAYHLYNDFNALWENLNSKNKGLIGHNTHMVLGLSPQRTLLLRTTPAGSNLTVESMLKSTWPNLELVVVPELSTAEGEKLYLIVNDEKVGLQAGFNAFSQRLQVSKIQHKRIFHLDKETSAPVSSGNGYHSICIAQDFSGATFGCVITQPSLISYMVGI